MFTLNLSVKSGCFSVIMVVNLTTATYIHFFPTMAFSFAFHAPKHHNKMASLNGWFAPSIISFGPCFFKPTFHQHFGLKLSIWQFTYSISCLQLLLPTKSLTPDCLAKTRIIALYAHLAAYVTPTYILITNLNHAPHPPSI